MTRVNDKSRFPGKQHFAVLVFCQHSAERYIAFESEHQLREWILEHEQYSDPEPYVVLRASPVSVKLKTKVSIE